MECDVFSSFHPLVNILYFAAVIGLAMFFMHPVNLGISMLCAMVYALYLYGKKALRMGIFMLPMMIVAAGMNPLFNHQGSTILAHLPNGNPLTLESTMFGIAAAVVIVTVIVWFSCFNAVMTSDKLIYLLGRVVPALSLILSMSLRAVPRFRAQIKIVANAQKCIGRDVSRGNVFQRARHGMRILSIMVTWSLENAIETADSMKGRGYGLPKRTAFSIFRFTSRDIYGLIYILICLIAIITGGVFEVYRFRYFPTIRHFYTHEGLMVVLFIVHFMLCAFPLIVNVKEDLIWKRIKSRT
ncbi:MAG: energy-coupling factor transporter transmembrane protein EcfT [Defluviitaleaceae bacterium]|nr:energy-coupling factor transporter transmembrane protein EcfT [Defluviitaleaceae bacterium]